MSVGGARRGAGRPRTTLVELVRGQRFDWTNQRHRRLLAREVPDWIQERLVECGRGELLAAYRTAEEWGDRTRAPWLAQEFARLVAAGTFE